MRCYRDEDEVDFAIVGTGAGGGTLACKLAEAGFSVVAFDAGPFWRPLEDFASDEYEQQKLYWLGERITGGDDPVELGSNNSGQSVGGSTVHFQMVSLRFRPDRFKARSRLGYAVDWPISPEEMWHYYDLIEDALKIAGPVNYPWGPPRPRYPYRQHEINAAGLVLARGCEALGINWAATPLATISAPRGKAHPCVYRGFCKFGCSTNAKQSALVTWIPRAIQRRGRDPRSGDGRPHRGRAARQGRPACNITAKASGAGSAQKMSSSPAMRSRRRGCCSTPPARNFPTGSPTAAAWSESF